MHIFIVEDDPSIVNALEALLRSEGHRITTASRQDEAIRLTREFAVLRSIGMGKQDFREMLTLECLDFAAKGFSIGLALGIAVTISMCYGASLSFSSVTFSLPWAYIGASLILTLAVLAASVIYALRKTRSSSIVEALKSDAG